MSNHTINQSLSYARDFLSHLNTLNYDQLDLQSKNTRNRIYQIRPDSIGKTIIIKKSVPNPKYRLSRKISFYLRNLVKHYGKRGYNGALALQQAGIKTIVPVAYWKEKLKFLTYRSCLAYEKVNATYDLKDFTDELFDPENSQHKILLRQYIREAAGIARQMHRRGIVHGDLVFNNFLIQAEQPIGARLIVIDTDHIGENRLPGKFLRQVYAMRCFRRMKDNYLTEHFLREYFEVEQTPLFWYKVIGFWRWHDRRPLSKFLKKITGRKIPDSEKGQNIQKAEKALQATLDYLKSH